MNLMGRKAEQMFKQLSDALYKNVGSRLVTESNENQKKLNEQLKQRLDEFEKNIRETARAIIKEEMNKEDGDNQDNLH